MSITDHKRIEGSDSCIYCLETWPCRTARILQEAADLIRAAADANGDYYQPSGMYAAADLIDPDEES